MTAGPAGPVALQAFAFDFQNSDHKIKTITLSRNGGETQAVFSDNDGNDPYTVGATYLPLAADLPVRSATIQMCGTECRAPIPVSPNDIVVLTGFSFERLNTDRDVVSVGIMPEPDFGYIDINFGQSFNEQILGSSVTVQYVLVPKVRVTARGLCWQREAGCSSTLAAGHNVIEGFDCRYSFEGWGRGGGHFLRDMRVTTLNQSQRYMFNDNDNDDYGGCTVRYATLR